MPDAITYQRLTETVHAFQGEIALFVAGMFLGAAITCAVCVRVWVRWQDEHHYRMVRIAATRVPVAGEVVPGHHSATYWQRAVNELQRFWRDAIGDLLDRVTTLEHEVVGDVGDVGDVDRDANDADDVDREPRRPRRPRRRDVLGWARAALHYLKPRPVLAGHQPPPDYGIWRAMS